MEDHAALVGHEGLKFRREGIELADGRERLGVIGKSAHGHIASSFFKGLFPSDVLHVAHLGIARSAVYQPPVIFAGSAGGNAPPLVSDGIGQQAVIDFLADIAAGNGGNLWPPPCRNGVIGQLNDFQNGGRGRAIDG